MLFIIQLQFNKYIAVIDFFSSKFVKLRVKISLLNTENVLR